MKKTMKKSINIKSIVFAMLAIAFFYACKKDASTPTAKVNLPYQSLLRPNSLTPYNQTNLVADAPGFGAAIIDPNLVNAWGMAASPTSPVWIASNGMHVSTIYNRTTGVTVLAPVAITGAAPGLIGSPTGVVFNGTADFGGYKFIFASEDGTISGWKGGAATTVVVDNSASGAVYKGLAMANDGTDNYLYATNFHAGTIDVFDKNFNPVPSRPLVTDPTIPAGFAPFGIQNIGGDLYLTYAKQKGPDNHDDQPGLGNGYVDVLNNKGSFLRRLASKGDLDSPWGMTVAPAGFATNVENLLVGNFGSGRIDIYDFYGVYMGQLLAHAKHLTIDGLWAIDFLKGNQHGVGSPTDSLYFTAGPNGETHGLYGFLTK